MTQILSTQPAQSTHHHRPNHSRTKTILTWFASITIALVAAYNFVIYPRISRWGATNEEVNAILPGDEYIDTPLITTTKAITIQATPADIWPWLIQLGVDRGGMYSYLWVENWLLHLHVTNAQQIHPEWQTLRAGDFIRFTPKEYPLNPGPGLYVKQLIPQQALVGCFGLEDAQPDCNKSATWQFVLQPIDANSTRFILRGHTAGQPTYLATWIGKLAQSFQFYMERKMLLSLKEIVERTKPPTNMTR